MIITQDESGLRFSDEDRGVWVTVPPQRFQPVDVRLDSVGCLTEAMGTQDDFHPLRVIGNLKFTNPNNPDQSQFTLEPPVQVRVRYTFMDLSRAMKRGKPLALAYWSDRDRRWVRFEEQPEAPDRVYLELRQFGDPAICWGT